MPILRNGVVVWLQNGLPTVAMMTSSSASESRRIPSGIYGASFNLDQVPLCHQKSDGYREQRRPPGGGNWELEMNPISHCNSFRCLARAKPTSSGSIRWQKNEQKQTKRKEAVFLLVNGSRNVAACQPSAVGKAAGLITGQECLNDPCTRRY